LTVRTRTLAALVVAAGAVVPAASAGGSFERVVGVGSNGRSAVITFQAGSADEVFAGKPTAVPTGRYVRIYPFVGDLPAIPGRFYPSARVVCLYWHEPASGCSTLGADAREVLAPLTRLARFGEAPTVVVAVSRRGRLLPYADGNVFAALELALERPAIRRPTSPPNGITLAIRWQGPQAGSMPRELTLTPIGAYGAGRLHPLGRGPWCFLAGHLRGAPAELIEATARICR
jgi:hypothetical protein